MDANRIVTEYVHAELNRHVCCEAPPRVVNLSASFREFAVTRGVRDILADEFVERQNLALVQKVMDYVEGWGREDMPAPIDFYGKGGDRLLTFAHERFEELTGRSPLPGEFGNTHGWIHQQGEREFLFVCAAQLVLMGASRVYVTDQGGDLGVDLIGRIDVGPNAGLCFFCQAKTASHAITRDLILLEYAKFIAGRTGGRFQEYLDALKVTKSGAGCSIVYCVMTNSWFQTSARGVSRDLGVLLRSCRQMAYFLSEAAPLARYQQARAGCGTLSVDLRFDLATPIVNAIR